jgi:hypothetical protein
MDVSNNNWNQRPYLHDVVLGKLGGSNWWVAYGATIGMACFLTTLPQQGVLRAIKLAGTSGLFLFSADWMNRNRAEKLLPEKVALLTNELDKRAALVGQYIDSNDEVLDLKTQLAAYSDWPELLVHQPLEIRNLLQRGVFRVTNDNWFGAPTTTADLPLLMKQGQPNIERLRCCQLELQRLSSLIKQHVTLTDNDQWESASMNQQRSDDAVLRDAMILAAFFAPVIFWMAT